VSTDAFYGTAAGLCFTMLGFWWAVVTFRHTELTSSHAGRRFAYLVSLYFLIPGITSTLSLLTGSAALWRLVFTAAGVLGMVSVIAALRFDAPLGAIRALARWSWLAIPFYALVTLIAIVPDIARSGLGLEPLQVEGFLIVAVMFLGSQLAWFLFMQTKPATPTAATAPGAPGASADHA
jgi:hypothetical protein